MHCLDEDAIGDADVDGGHLNHLSHQFGKRKAAAAHLNGAGILQKLLDEPVEPVDLPNDDICELTLLGPLLGTLR